MTPEQTAEVMRTLGRIEEKQDASHRALTGLEPRVTKLEQLKYKVLGASAVIAFLVPLVFAR